MTPAVADAMAWQMTREAGMAPHLYLSRREFQLFLKLARVTISQAADALCLSVKTATSYRTRLMAKMAMRSNHQLSYHALESELNHQVEVLVTIEEFIVQRAEHSMRAPALRRGGRPSGHQVCAR